MFEVLGQERGDLTDHFDHPHDEQELEVIELEADEAVDGAENVHLGLALVRGNGNVLEGTKPILVSI